VGLVIGVAAKGSVGPAVCEQKKTKKQNSVPGVRIANRHGTRFGVRQCGNTYET